MQATAVLYILLHFSFCTSNPTCPEEEVYSNCGSACPLTCDSQPDQFCTTQCVPGCYCPAGQVRNQDGRCMPSEYCPRCPAGETWQQCGSACPETCSQPCPPSLCTLQCVPQCGCNEGTIRDTITNQCVRPEDCTCPPKEWFSLCKSACEPTCAEPLPACTKQCVVGCTCRKDYIRDQRNNLQCIPITDCPRTIGNIDV